jgi:hypothetical protein
LKSGETVTYSVYEGPFIDMSDYGYVLRLQPKWKLNKLNPSSNNFEIVDAVHTLFSTDRNNDKVIHDDNEFFCTKIDVVYGGTKEKVKERKTKVSSRQALVPKLGSV